MVAGRSELLSTHICRPLKICANLRTYSCCYWLAFPLLDREKITNRLSVVDYLKTNKQVLDNGNSDTFTSDMLVALISGRKITPKMENAINNIIKRNSPEEQFKRDEWVEKVVPKIMMVQNMLTETTWTKGYRGEAHNFLNSIIKQAKSRKTLSKKQMEAVSKMYVRVKKNIDKKIDKKTTKKMKAFNENRRTRHDNLQ